MLREVGALTWTGVFFWEACVVEQIESYEVGDRIEHRLVPGFWMTVLDTRACETSDHRAYKIVDFTGAEDWLCAYDVRRDSDVLARNGPMEDVSGGVDPAGLWTFPRATAPHARLSGPHRHEGKRPVTD